jgi:predicted nucleic acid-binding Zn ribbon protein
MPLPRSHDTPTEQPAIAGRTARKAEAKARAARKRYRARIAAGLCVGCGERSPGHRHCVKCLVALRERSRTPGSKRRASSALSYKRQGAAGRKLLQETAAFFAARDLMRQREIAARGKAEVRAKWAALGKTGPVRGGPAPIQDEFANLPVSRQRKYQLRKAKERRCVICGDPAVTATLCVRHMVYAREQTRRRRGTTTRRKTADSYRLQQQSAASRKAGKS